MKRSILALTILTLYPFLTLTMEEKSLENKSAQLADFFKLIPGLKTYTIEQEIIAILNDNPDPMKAILAAFGCIRKFTSVNQFCYSKKPTLIERLKQLAKEKFAPEYAHLTTEEATKELDKVIKKCPDDLSDLIIKLVIAGANPNTKYKPCDLPGYKLTLLGVVVSNLQSTDSIKFLKFYGADVNYDTPWYEIGTIKDLELRSVIAKLVIAAGADVNKLNSKGALPLNILLEHRNMFLIPILLQHGAKIDIKDAKDRTPLDLATSIGWASILNSNN